MVCFGEVQLLQVFSEDDDRVTDEQVCEVRGEHRVHTAVHELLLDVGVEDEVRVEVFFAQARVFGDVG